MNQTVLVTLSALVVAPLVAQPVDFAQAPAEVCGGYRLDAVVLSGIIWLAAASLDSTDRKMLCGYGTQLNDAVRTSGWRKTRADSLWEALVVRFGFCAGHVVDQRVRTEMQKWAGLPLEVTQRYCVETWDFQKGGLRLAGLVTRTTWVRNELFCELGTFDRGGVAAFFETMVDAPPSVTALRELGSTLCSEVRAGTLSVNDALSRLNREHERARGKIAGEIVEGTASATGRHISWTVKVLVAAVGLIGTVIAIFVGVQRLSHRGE